jgi:hypothetical protein
MSLLLSLFLFAPFFLSATSCPDDGAREHHPLTQDDGSGDPWIAPGCSQVRQPGAGIHFGADEPYAFLAYVEGSRREELSDLTEGGTRFLDGGGPICVSGTEEGSECLFDEGGGCSDREGDGSCERTLGGALLSRAEKNEVRIEELYELDGGGFIDTLEIGVSLVKDKGRLSELPGSFEGLMEHPPIAERYKVFRNEAFSGKPIDIEDEEALKSYSGELIATPLEVAGRQHITLLPREFLEEQDGDPLVYDCSCAKYGEGNEGGCGPRLRGSGIICIAEGDCMGCHLQMSSIKELD